MKLEHLAYLKTIAECGSINQAAKKLYISQPTLSSIISSLEKELHAPLFERTKKGISLTEFGQKVVFDLDDIFARIQDWHNYSIDHSPASMPESTIKINTFHMVGNNILPHIVNDLSVDYPSLSLEYCFFPNCNLIDNLNNGIFDIGLCGLTSNENEIFNQIKKNRHWQYEIVYQEKYQLYISTEHPMAKFDEITMEDIFNIELPFSFNLTGEYLNEFPYLNVIKRKEQQYKSIKTSSYISALEVVAQNKAIALYPQIASLNNYYINTNKIKVLDIKNYFMPLSHCLIYRKDNYISLAERIVVRYIKNFYKTFNVYSF